MFNSKSTLFTRYRIISEIPYTTSQISRFPNQSCDIVWYTNIKEWLCPFICANWIIDVGWWSGCSTSRLLRWLFHERIWSIVHTLAVYCAGRTCIKMLEKAEYNEIKWKSKKEKNKINRKCIIRNLVVMYMPPNRKGEKWISIFIIQVK